MHKKYLVLNSDNLTQYKYTYHKSIFNFDHDHKQYVILLLKLTTKRNYMKYTIICLLTIAQITYGQNACEENSNSKIAADLVYSEKDHPNDYNIIRSSWIAFEDPSYLAPVPLVIPYKPRRIELREFEKAFRHSN